MDSLKLKIKKKKFTKNKAHDKFITQKMNKKFEKGKKTDFSKYFYDPLLEIKKYNNLN